MAMQQSYRMPESGYNVHRPTKVDPEGREHPTHGYSKSTIHVTKTEHFVEISRTPTMADFKYKPPTNELYENHGVGVKPLVQVKPLLVPWGFARDTIQPTTDDFSPRDRHKVIYLESGKEGPRPYLKEEGYNDHNETYKGNNGYAPNKTSDRDVELENKNGKNLVVTHRQHYDSPTRKESIESVESPRRYGRADSRVGAYVEEKYRDVIDSKEAARKYNGVLFKAY